MNLARNRATHTYYNIKSAAMRSVLGAAKDIIDGHTIECRFHINTVWMIDGCRRSAIDTLAFLNELYKEKNDG